MAFYYKFEPLSDRGHHEQWQRSLDQANLINNIDDIVRTQTADYNNALKHASQRQAEIMRASTEAVCGTISDGLADVTEGLATITHGLSNVVDGLSNIENAIYGLTNLLDTHLQTIVSELKYNNLLSQNIALLLREPDSEKVRQKNIEKGLKFYQDALRNPFFYSDALLFLKRAVEDEQTGDHTDYFVLHKIGLIYLYSKDLLNLDDAIRYFEKAAIYSEVDTHPYSRRLANILAPHVDITKSLQGQDRTVDNIKYLAGKSYMQISIAYYNQGKFADAISYADRGFTIAPSLLEAGFRWAKSLAASNQNEKAAEILKPVIQQDEVYSIRTLLDPDLATKAEILQMNEELRLEARDNARILFEKSSELREKVINEWRIMESTLAHNFTQLCRNIDIAEASFNKGRYLSYLRAKKHLDRFILDVDV